MSGQLRSWRAAFPASSFQLFTLNEWHRAPAAARRRLFDFLGLPASSPPPPPPPPSSTSGGGAADEVETEDAATATAADRGQSCAEQFLSREADWTLARGRVVPRGAAAALKGLYAEFSAPLRSELALLGQPLHRQHSWLKVPSTISLPLGRS